MLHQRPNHQPEPHEHHTQIEDSVLAEEMAYAADPHYQELIEGGRNLSVNQMVDIGIHIGESMEAARRKHLQAAAGSGVVKETVAPQTPARGFASAVLAASIETTPPRTEASPLPPAELQQPTLSPVEVENKNFERNVQSMVETASSIMTTYADPELDLVTRTSLSENMYVSRSKDKASEEMILYHPDNGAVTFLKQEVTYDRNNGRSVDKTQIRSISPLSNITKPVEAKKPDVIGNSQAAIKNPSKLSKEQPMAEEDILTIVNVDGYNVTTSINAYGEANVLTSAELSEWITRFEKAVPLTKEEFNMAFKKFEPGQGGTNQVAAAGPKGEVMRTVSYQKLASRRMEKIIAAAQKRRKA